MSNVVPTLVVVEDDFVDLEIVKRGVAKKQMEVGIINAADGNSALELLRSDCLTDQQRSQLIVLLDINMPGMNGHQFLEAIRADETLRRTIVFILTTSDHPRDISRAYDRNVAGYFLKSNVDGLLETLAIYLDHVKFPPVVSLQPV
ncbi:Response regulator rcp1 [Stieleria maiorica]|uniref:Response regulator rcp1 n=1 Tax=Stieleria maiorica TaxID=2795974 RepID=A0A5B9MCK2_9BACT|nr:response regulator [Stieleria maiorica]QEF98503.1 Response regulator rcp1 [Stieleria maiorica]